MASRSTGRNASSVGMMEGAFFVGRTELLDWVNGLLGVSLTKVEQCASGAIYCQIVDACNPGTVKMPKVNWMARSDHEFIPNYKLLQAAFDRNSIQKHVDVDKLIRAKYQDNLEFLQWMKAMWDREGSGIKGYDAIAARGGRPVPDWAKGKLVPGQARPVPGDSIPEKENVSANRDQIGGAQKFDPKRRVAAAKAPARTGLAPRAGTQRSTAPPALSSSEAEELKVKVMDQEEELDDLRSTLEGLENERDYYFKKLRHVEILCETLQAKMDPALDVAGVISEVQGILYAENDEVPEDQNVAAAVGLPLEGPELDAAPELPRFEAEVGVAVVA